MPAYWLLKSEPSEYPFKKLESQGRTRWDGIRSAEARNNLRAMSVGDLCLFYHSNVGKDVVGVVRVSRAAFADPTAEEGDWSAIEIEPEYSFVQPVTLEVLKAGKVTSKMAVVTKSRLSVTPVTAAEWKVVHTLGKTNPR